MLPQPSADRKNINRLKKIAVTASVSVSAGLALIKLAASLYTGSLAVLSSMVDSLSDIFSSLISFIAVKFSSQPASVEHRYGFGRRYLFGKGEEADAWTKCRVCGCRL